MKDFELAGIASSDVPAPSPESEWAWTWGDYQETDFTLRHIADTLGWTTETSEQPVYELVNYVADYYAKLMLGIDLNDHAEERKALLRGYGMKHPWGEDAKAILLAQSRSVEKLKEIVQAFYNSIPPVSDTARLEWRQNNHVPEQIFVRPTQSYIFVIRPVRLIAEDAVITWRERL